MPPDEYYSNVNNSVYTNTVAKLRYSKPICIFLHFMDVSLYSYRRRINGLVFSLQFAVLLADLLKHPAPKEWEDVADNLLINFDQQSRYHPEFEGYAKGFLFNLLAGSR